MFYWALWQVKLWRNIDFTSLPLLFPRDVPSVIFLQLFMYEFNLIYINFNKSTFVSVWRLFQNQTSFNFIFIVSCICTKYSSSKKLLKSFFFS